MSDETTPIRAILPKLPDDVGGNDRTRAFDVNGHPNARKTAHASTSGVSKQHAPSSPPTTTAAFKPREPHPNSPGLAVGIDEELIRKIVDAFYASVRADKELGPIFESAVADWPAHLNRLRGFWSSVTLITGAYKGDLIQAHLALPGLTERSFQKWFELFDQTLQELCTHEQARFFRSRAWKIAGRIHAAIARTANDGLLSSA